MSKLITSLKDTLFSPVYNIMSEFVEIGIDELLNDGMLRKIPFVRAITSFCELGCNLRERNLIKQALNFIIEFEAGRISEEKLDAHRKYLDSHPEEAEKELSRILILLNEHIEQIRSKVLGSFYAAYINGDISANRMISWERFCELSEANRRMFISDYKILAEAVVNEGLKIQNRELYQADRLISLGLLQNKNRGGSLWNNIINDSQELQNDVIVTSFGKDFYHNSERILKNLNENHIRTC